MAKGVQRTGNNITGVSGAQQGAARNAASMQRGAGLAGQTGYEFGGELGVSGAQQGARKNAQAMQRAGAAGAASVPGNAGQTGYEFGSELGAGNRAQLTGNNVTGVGGAQQGAKRNAQAMQRLGERSGQY